MTVRKLLVLGLGSTGADICNDLADRLIEEFGALERVPWIRFLCVETNTGATGTLTSGQDMMTLPITSAEYESNVKDPSVLDGAIHWLTWRDKVLVESVRDVQSGAGNKRMIGRLAFLFPKN